MIDQISQFANAQKWCFFKNLDTKKGDVAEFDKLVWARGILSELYYPKATHSRLINGGFKGRIKHSADVVDIDSSIEGKQMVAS